METIVFDSLNDTTKIKIKENGIEGRKKKVKEDTEKALETMKKLGLLISYEIKKGVYGEDKIIFTLNKDFE